MILSFSDLQKIFFTVDVFVYVFINILAKLHYRSICNVGYKEERNNYLQKFPNISFFSLHKVAQFGCPQTLIYFQNRFFLVSDVK